MKIEMDEAQLTQTIKEALKRYAPKSFGHASFNQKPEGIEIQFHDASDEGLRKEESDREEVDPLGLGKRMLTTWALMDLAGSGQSIPQVPSLGGGASGGAEATGEG